MLSGRRIDVLGLLQLSIHHKSHRPVSRREATRGGEFRDVAVFDEDRGHIGLLHRGLRHNLWLVFLGAGRALVAWLSHRSFLLVLGCIDSVLVWRI
jgi:hypothetical protein